MVRTKILQQFLVRLSVFLIFSILAIKKITAKLITFTRLQQSSEPAKCQQEMVAQTMWLFCFGFFKTSKSINRPHNLPQNETDMIFFSSDLKIINLHNVL